MNGLRLMLLTAALLGATSGADLTSAERNEIDCLRSTHRHYYSIHWDTDLQKQARKTLMKKQGRVARQALGTHLTGCLTQSNNLYINYDEQRRNTWSLKGTTQLPSCSFFFPQSELNLPPIADIVLPNTTTCRFTPSYYTCTGDYLGIALSECLSATWNCNIPDVVVCTGYSQCLTDECGCPGVDQFYCGDGLGCVSLDVTCDGKFDCLDRSDERVCDGLQMVNCSIEDTLGWSDSVRSVEVPVSTFSRCSHRGHGVFEHHVHPFVDCQWYECREEDFTGSKLAGYYKMKSCLDDMADLLREAFADLQTWINVNATDICLNKCRGRVFREFCENLISGSSGSTPGSLLEYECKEDYIQPLSVCDGNFDCEDRSDELHCFDRFYCSKNLSQLSWVSLYAKCNSYKDCDNGLDECDNCTDGLLSSDQYIVRNHAVFAWLMVSCLGNLVLNAYIFWDNISSGFKGQKNYVKVDRFLKIQICVYDALLGFYLLALVIANIKFWGNYCVTDDEWRSSWICKILGVIFNFSCHGSLLSVLILSLTRAYKCNFSYSEGIRLRKVVITSVIMTLINLTHSIIPIIPLESIQSTFRTKLTVSQRNPFIMHDFDNLTHIDRIYAQYFGDAREEVGIYGKLDALKNITNRPEFFRYKELSFYSWSPVCVQDLYGHRESLKVYKAIYIVCIVVVLLILTVSYVKIVQVFLRSRKEVNPTTSNEDDKAKIKAKVALIIGTKLVSWLTIVVAMMYFHFSGNNVPNGWFEATAICIVPANSLVNPIFNSEIFQKIKKWTEKSCCRRSAAYVEEVDVQQRPSIKYTANVGQ
ncbi:hypothetical protein ACHWQZ_G019454 [Mnemiopsis leidyi]